MDCISWNIDPIAFQLGPITFTWYGVAIALFFISSYFVLEWQFRKAGLNSDKVFNLLASIVVSATAAAFVFHRVFYEWDTLISNPGRLFNFQNGVSGLSSHGVLLGTTLAVFVFARIYKMSFWNLADRCSFGGALSAFFIRLGNLANSEIIGTPTDSPWAFCFTKIDHIPRHPSQIYEAFIGLFIFGILVIVDKKISKENRPNGLLIGLCVTLLFVFRFFAEFFKERQAVGEDSLLSMGQYLSIPYALLGVAFMVYILKRHKKKQSV